ncbi:MAG: hypothetical protein M3248_00530, partial [Actinomycetota bacterium]|nr:hypothetical protein [Actinomycetota bacterium]
MGDSFTYGNEVQYEDTLQARLEARFRGVNIANFGMSGRNSRYFAAMTRRALACTGLPSVDAAVVGIYTD